MNTLINTFQVDANTVLNIYNTQMVKPNELDTKDWLVSSLNLGVMRSIAYQTTQDDGSTKHELYIESIFDSLKNANISITYDNGFGYAFDTFTDNNNQLNGGGNLSISSYASVYDTTKGMMYIGILNNGADVRNGTVYIYLHDNGYIVHMSSTYYNTYFVLTDSKLYAYGTMTDLHFGYVLPSEFYYYPVQVVSKNVLCSVYTQTYIIQGTVTDDSGRAVSGVEIIAYRKSDKLMLASGVSDTNGSYTIEVSAQKDSVCYLVAITDSSSELNSQIIDTIIIQ